MSEIVKINLSRIQNFLINDNDICYFKKKQIKCILTTCFRFCLTYNIEYLEL